MGYQLHHCESEIGEGYIVRVRGKDSWYYVVS